MAIRQGDIYWVDDGEPDGSAPGYTRPYVIIQNDFYNTTRLRTVLACALTTNLRRANAPENILLLPGEADLQQQSVILTSQTQTIDKDQLGDYIGTLSLTRINQILEGLALLTISRAADEKSQN